jgi:type II secretory pathway pseudopilin PulG
MRNETNLGRDFQIPPPSGRQAGSAIPPYRLSSAFTLLELLVVIGLIAGLSFVLFAGLQGGGRTAALQSAQATVAQLVSAARLKAAASGRHCRVLVANDPAETDRYLRFLVLQQATDPGANPANWRSVQSVWLPADIYVVPASLTAPAGLVADATGWRRVSEPGEELRSGVFQNQATVHALEGDSVARTWTGVCFTPAGTLAPLDSGPPPRGLWVLAPGVRRAPGTYAAGESPVQLVEPDTVRGLVLSAYGVPALLNGRGAF